jgi:hypothetical protein
MAGENSLGCRQYHGGNPSMTTPGTHCPHAGPTGGDSQPGDDVLATDAGDAGDPTPGTCGGACDSFCNLVLGVCTGTNKQFDNKAACFATCKTFPAVTLDGGALATYNDTYTNGAAGSGNFFCRMYHANAAATNPAVHCPHTNPASVDAGTDPCH